MRPHPDVAAALAQVIQTDEPTLLLGVTPELAEKCNNLLAVDRSPMMIAKLWPGNSQTRNVLQDDWLSMELAEHSFASAIGDGSFNSVSFPDGHVRLYQQLRKFVKLGGQLAFRVYLTPDVGETIAELVLLTTKAAECSFQVFKWRLMMAMVTESANANVQIHQVWLRFQALFPDRARVAQQTGWALHDIDSIDIYRGSTEVYNFPTKAQLLDVIPPDFEHMLKPIGTYELAERCPLLFIKLPRPN